MSDGKEGVVLVGRIDGAIEYSLTLMFGNKVVYCLIHLLAYSGDTCSEDRNGCAEIECFSGVECFDVPAPGEGAMCGPCSTGFTGDGVKCSGNNIIMKKLNPIIIIYFLSVDIDECAETSSLCDQICVNTFGSYVCTCEPGYNLNDQMICEGRRI